MIHRTMFLELLLLFSSAMRSSTTQTRAAIKCRVKYSQPTERRRRVFQGLAAELAEVDRL